MPAPIQITKSKWKHGKHLYLLRQLNFDEVVETYVNRVHWSFDCIEPVPERLPQWMCHRRPCDGAAHSHTAHTQRFIFIRCLFDAGRSTRGQNWLHGKQWAARSHQPFEPAHRLMPHSTAHLLDAVNNSKDQPKRAHTIQSLGNRNEPDE